MSASSPSRIMIAVPQGIETFFIRPDVPGQRLTDEEFEQFCAENPEMRIEMTKEGEMIIMLPVVTKGGNRNLILSQRVANWAEADGSGIAFDSSTGYTLPNGAKRSPDVSWIRLARWEALTEEEQNEFAPICPDFAVELRSKSDRLKPLQEKMEEYILNGAELGWLIDPIEKQVHVYRPDLPVHVLDRPTELSGEPLLKGFLLSLAGIID